MTHSIQIGKPLSQMTIENPQLSVTTSIEFLKKVTVMAVSYITSMRKVFPKEAFDARKWQGTKIKILKESNKAPGSKEMIECLKNAFKCAETQNLNKLHLVIHKISDGATIEVYTIRFTYNHDEINVHIDHPDSETDEANKALPDEIKKQIKQLLFNLEDHMKKLPELPLDHDISLRIEVTGDENFKEPAMFTRLDSLDFSFPPDTRTLKLGHADGKFTKFAVSTKSALLSKIEEEDEVVEIIKEFSLLEEPNPLNCNSPVNVTNAGMKENSESTKLSETMSSVHLRDKDVKCICEKDDDILETIKCASCNIYQHKACYKLLENENVERHICVNCHKPNNETLTCTNVELLSEEGKDEALYRRALSLCESTKKVSAHTFESHLNISRNDARKIFRRLTEDGCFNPDSKDRNIRIVDLDRLNNNILRFYFNTAAKKNVYSMDVQEESPLASVKGRQKRNYNTEDNISTKRFKNANSRAYTTRAIPK